MKVSYWKCSRSPVSDGVWENRSTSLPVSSAIVTSPYQASRYVPAYFSSGSDGRDAVSRSEEHTSELQSPCNLVCRLLLEKKKTTTHSQEPGSAQQVRKAPTRRRQRRLTPQAGRVRSISCPDTARSDRPQRAASAALC